MFNFFSLRTWRHLHFYQINNVTTLPYRPQKKKKNENLLKPEKSCVTFLWNFRWPWLLFVVRWQSNFKLNTLKLVFSSFFVSFFFGSVCAPFTMLRDAPRLNNDDYIIMMRSPKRITPDIIYQYSSALLLFSFTCLHLLHVRVVSNFLIFFVAVGCRRLFCLMCK